MKGVDPEGIPMEDPNKQNLVAEVSVSKPVTYNADGHIRIMAVDCGIKNNQIRCLCSRGVSVTVVPWDYPLKSSGNYIDGIVFYYQESLIRLPFLSTMK